MPVSDTFSNNSERSADSLYSLFAAQCSRREYSSHDIREKLRSRSVEEAQAAKILQRLLSEGFVDDRRYAVAFVRDKSVLAGWGVDKISFSLRRKGIAPEVISEALEEMDIGAAGEKMRRVVESKWRSVKGTDERERVRKVLRYAMGRGYRYEEVMEVVKSIEK